MKVLFTLLIFIVYFNYSESKDLNNRLSKSKLINRNKSNGDIQRLMMRAPSCDVCFGAVETVRIFMSQESIKVS